MNNSLRKLLVGSLLIYSVELSYAQSILTDKSVRFEGRVLAELQNPFDTGLRTVGPRHRLFVVEIMRQTPGISARHTLVRYEYSSWEQDGLGKRPERYSTVWQFDGRRDKQCDASLQTMKGSAVGDSASEMRVNVDALNRLPPHETVLSCIVVGSRKGMIPK